MVPQSARECGLAADVSAGVTMRPSYPINIELLIPWMWLLAESSCRVRVQPEDDLAVGRVERLRSLIHDKANSQGFFLCALSSELSEVWSNVLITCENGRVAIEEEFSTSIKHLTLYGKRSAIFRIGLKVLDWAGMNAAMNAVLTPVMLVVVCSLFSVGSSGANSIATTFAFVVWCIFCSVIVLTIGGIVDRWQDGKRRRVNREKDERLRELTEKCRAKIVAELDRITVSALDKLTGTTAADVDDALTMWPNIEIAYSSFLNKLKAEVVIGSSDLGH